jgi:hypothetical protein
MFPVNINPCQDFYFEAQEKKKHSPARRRRSQLLAQLIFTWASMRIFLNRKLGFGSGQDSTITGNFNLNLIQKK